MARKRKIKFASHIDRLAGAAIALGLAAALCWSFPSRTFYRHHSYEYCLAYFSGSETICGQYKDNEWVSYDWSYITGLFDGSDPNNFVPFTQAEGWCTPNCTIPDRVEVKWFPAERTPFAVALLAGSFFVLLLRRR